MTKNIPVAPDDRRRFCVSDDDILKLAKWACIIEDHYSEKRGQHTPMDMEWAKDGITGDAGRIHVIGKVRLSERPGGSVNVCERNVDRIAQPRLRCWRERDIRRTRPGIECRFDRRGNFGLRKGAWGVGDMVRQLSVAQPWTIPAQACSKNTSTFQNLNPEPLSCPTTRFFLRPTQRPRC